MREKYCPVWDHHQSHIWTKTEEGMTTNYWCPGD